MNCPNCDIQQAKIAIMQRRLAIMSDALHKAEIALQLEQELHKERAAKICEALNWNRYTFGKLLELCKEISNPMTRHSPEVFRALEAGRDYGSLF